MFTNCIEQIVWTRLAICLLVVLTCGNLVGQERNLRQSTQQSVNQQQQVYGAASSPNAEFQSAIRDVINRYRYRGVDQRLIDRVENALKQNNNTFNPPQVRIRNIDSSGVVYVFFGKFEPPSITLQPGGVSDVININGGPVYVQAFKTDQWGNSRVTDVLIEQVNNVSAKFWDGDDYRYFTIPTGRSFPRGLNNRADLSRYRIERQ